LKNQNPEKIGMPSILDAINDLQSLDVKLHCVEEHLKARDIQKENLIGDIKIIREEEISDLILGCDAVAAF
jgi:sulfur relay (sulfurtransferase) DsrF/TusC family protein